MNREQGRILKSMINKRNAWQLKLVEWVCDSNEWLKKHMYLITKLFDKKFTSKDLPLKSTQSCELIKKWHEKGLIMKVSYGKKANEYRLSPGLFIKTIESRRELKPEEKEALTTLLDEIL